MPKIESQLQVDAPKRITLFPEPELGLQLARAAKESRRSMAQWALLACEEKLEREAAGMRQLVEASA